MKKENTALYVARLAITLLIIAAVMAAALAGVNSVTAPKIAALKAEKTQQAIELVLPGGGTEVEAPAVDLVSKVYQGENGYAVEVVPVGFDNVITMMVGVDNEGKVLGISVISNTETAGLGARSKDEAFTSQFAGKTAPLSVAKGNDERNAHTIDAITSATITSKSVTGAANDIMAALDGVLISETEGGAQ